jgi:glycosyltransferase involved in cell wall biosynthesis
VVVAHGSTTGWACTIARIGTGTPMVYRQISDPQFWATTAARRLRTRVMLARASRVVALSDVYREYLEENIGISPDRTRVIPNGVPAECFPFVDPVDRPRVRAGLGLPDRSTVLVVGALSPEKRVELAIDAIARLPDAQLVVAGDGPERARLVEHAARSARQRVHFVGAVPDPSSFYAAADVVVLTSATEGMPASLVEAGLCGVPVVAARVGGVSNIVEDGVTGTLVDVTHPGALVGALQAVLADPARARLLGAAARERCRARFTLDSLVPAWEAVLLEAAGRS